MPGTLTYHPEDGLALELIGGWDAEIRKEVAPGVFDILEGGRRWPLLHGLAENRDITLLDCVPIHTMARNFGPPEKQTIQVRMTLSGIHLDTEDQAIFTERHVAVEDLTMWSHTSVLSGTVGREGWRPDGTGSIVAQPVEDATATVNGVATSLVHEHTLPYFESTRDGTVARMRETRYIRFRPPEPWALATAQKQAKMVQDLLSLALHRSCGLLWLRLKIPPEERDYPEDYPVHDRDVDVYAVHTVPAEPSANAVKHHQALFTCEHLPFEDIWPRWSEVHERCVRASDMILGLRYAPARFIEGRFLTATGAAEVLHRALGEVQPPIPKDEFSELRRKLLDHTPESHRDWVKEKLRNDVSLKERLQDLAGLPDSEAMKRLVPDVERWATVTTQARNDLTHEGYTRRQSIDEVIAAVKVTSAVVVMNILQALGVPNERQREIVNENPEFRQTAQQARDDLGSEPPGGEST